MAGQKPEIIHVRRRMSQPSWTTIFMVAAMSSRHQRQYRKIDKKGRSRGQARFVMLEHWLLDCEAYRSLKPIPRAVYTELRRRFNGLNNGQIIASVRDLAEACKCSKDGVQDALKDLEKKGFIKAASRGSFHYKKRHAPTWILTDQSLRDALPTREFLRWLAPEKKSRSQKQDDQS
jgi:hypothetical protein